MDSSWVDYKDLPIESYRLQMMVPKRSTIYIRTVRFLRHVFLPVQDTYLLGLGQRKRYGLLLLHWFLELPLLALDIIGMPEWFAFFQALFKPTSRKLNEHELKLAESIFGSSFDATLARIDENSRVGTHGGKYAFVSYYYINCIGRLNLPILIHELVHIFQFIQVGSPYALRNLMAHITPPTYDYGGLEMIRKICADPRLVHHLNYEQRADVFSDYCLLLMGQKPEWGSAGRSHGNEYRFVIQLILQ